jgi:hypothetical protein
MASACRNEDADDEYREREDRADNGRSTTSERGLPTMGFAGRFARPRQGLFMVSGRHDKNLDPPRLPNQSRSSEPATSDARYSSSLRHGARTSADPNTPSPTARPISSVRTTSERKNPSASPRKRSRPSINTNTSVEIWATI